MKTGTDPTTLFVRPAEGKGGHAITPYAIVPLDNGVFRIKVYDNNNPNDNNRFVTIDTKNNEWFYNLGSQNWSGDANTHTLGIVPISKYAEQSICPWCRTSLLSADVSGSNGHLWSSGSSHLLITDEQGRRIGYVNDQFVNEVPSAKPNYIDTGLGVELEPFYVLPLSTTYTILLDGQTLTSTEVTEVTQFGPGYAISVNNISLDSTSQDELKFTSDGTGLTYMPTHTKEITFSLAVDSSEGSDEFQIWGGDVGAGQAVSVTTNLTQTLLIFNNSQTNGGNYDLIIEHVDVNGGHSFSHRDISIAASDTHYFDYGTWQETNVVTLTVDYSSDGTMDEVVALANQTSLSVYLPIIIK